MDFGWVGDVAVPSAAIIISTLVAVWIARFERRAAEKARREEAVQNAAAALIESLTPFISISAESEEFNSFMRQFRARSVVLQAIVREADRPATSWFAHMGQRMIMKFDEAEKDLWRARRLSVPDAAEEAQAKTSEARALAMIIIERITRWMRSPEEVIVEIEATQRRK